MVTYTHESDYKFSFQGSPWIIVDHYLLVQRWRPDFNLEKDSPKNVAVWFRVSSLPLEYYNHCFLWSLTVKEGFPLKVDAFTSLTSRGKFARICAKVGLRKNLVSKIILKGESYPIEYEGLKLICLTRNKHGHHKEQCPMEIEKNATKLATMEEMD